MTGFRRRMNGVCGTIGVILVLLTAGAVRAEAQTCLEGYTNSTAGYGGRVAADGVIEFTYRVTPYGMPGGLSDMIHYAILEAIDRWNAQSGHTNMRLVPASSGITENLNFNLNNFILDPCGDFDPNGQAIRLTQQLWDIAGEHGYGYEWAVATVAHTR